jgi:hypothetical protein
MSYISVEPLNIACQSAHYDSVSSVVLAEGGQDASLATQKAVGR